MRRAATLFATVMTILASVHSGIASPAAANTPKSPSSQSARKGAALKDAITQLIGEAQEIQRDQRMSKTNADFVSRWDREIPAEELVKAIVTPCHKDRFIDAYVRWQLTSFNPDLPALTDQQMHALMVGAPGFVLNPRAADEIIELFDRAAKLKKPPQSDLQRLRDASNDLDYRTRAAEELNTPATGWRDWIAGKLPVKGPRQLQWHIERAAATSTAGWPVRTVKAKMTKEFKAGANDSDESFSQRDRDLVADQARKLIGLKRRAINEITFLADGSIKVSFSNNEIDKDDVEKWIASMQKSAATP